MLDYIGSCIAIDPGGSYESDKTTSATGICVWYPPALEECQRMKELTPDHLTLMQIRQEDHHHYLEQYLNEILTTALALTEANPFRQVCTKRPLTVICERFDFRKTDQHREKINYRPAEYVGVVKAFAQKQARTVHLVMQTPAVKDGFWKDPNNIGTIGCWVPGQRHAMDALRHFLYYTTFTLNDKSLLRLLKDD